jgi:hypothetical protein
MAAGVVSAQDVDHVYVIGSDYYTLVVAWLVRTSAPHWP